MLNKDATATSNFQLTRWGSRLLIQIHILNDKQCKSRSVGFFRSQLIWIYTVCKDRAYPGSAGQGFSNSPETSSNFHQILCEAFCQRGIVILFIWSPSINYQDGHNAHGEKNTLNSSSPVPRKLKDWTLACRFRDEDTCTSLTFDIFIARSNYLYGKILKNHLLKQY